MNRSCPARFPLWLLLIVAAWLVCGHPTGAMAGGGPENVLLVVNRNSPTSVTIANHYIRLREIPAGNVLSLPWDPAAQTTGIDTFRQEILTPVLAAIQKRRLTGQIDYVVYSSDFPWGINVSSDLAKFLVPGGQIDPSRLGSGPRLFQPPGGPKGAMGSLSGLTYLWQPVMANNAGYLGLTGNQYMRRASVERKVPTSLGFSSTHEFGPNGESLDSAGRRYLLSMMLAVTAGRGNSLAEVLGYLRRSATADGTHPRGTIYYAENKDVRSKARHDGFPAAVRELKTLGVAAEIVQGKTPVGKKDVRGVMMGTANFNWKASGNTILPGAICEHFTSFGGIMRSGAGQTPLSEFLRYGAAGASGTVVEPYSVPHKFPAATIHVHYARGCTLAEAFYQSVFAPYQLLIVGDPLCRPWADVPRVTAEGLQPGTTVKGNLSLKPSATIPGGSSVDRFELLIDGWRRATCRPGQPLEFDTALLGDGYHELRVVAVQTGPIQSQGRRIFSFSTANHGRKITASVAPRGTVRAGKPLVVTADSPGSIGIAVLHNSRLVGRIPGQQGQVEIDPAKLGFGPVRLRVVGLGKGGSTSYAWARPIELTVEGSP